jgi:hypothetical protein
MKTILAAPTLLKIEKIALYPREVRLVAHGSTLPAQQGEAYDQRALN